MACEVGFGNAQRSSFGLERVGDLGFSFGGVDVDVFDAVVEFEPASKFGACLVEDGAVAVAEIELRAPILLRGPD